LETSWAKIQPAEMQEEVKDLFKKLKAIKGLDRKSDVAQGIIKEI
jgi:hypothetical protein